jgi:hypothetical protein
MFKLADIYSSGWPGGFSALAGSRQLALEPHQTTL